MSTNERFEHKYRDTFSNLGAVQTMFPTAAKDQMAQLLEEAARFISGLR